MDSLKRWRLAFLAAAAAAYAAGLIATGFLSFAPFRDERHFWPAALWFSGSLLPSLERLRGYNELNTPLPFVAFGALERLFGGGIAAGRLLNAALSLAMLCWVGLPRPARPSEGPRCGLGLCLFPYFAGLSFCLYTDMMAAAFVLLGAALHARRRHALSAAAFCLAIASRQYAVAFPLGLLAWEAWRMREEGFAWRSSWLGPLAACCSLLFWFWLFGGVAPPAALKEQGFRAGGFAVAYPRNAVYFLSCLGVYFVLIEAALFGPRFPWLRSRRAVIAAGAACLAFLLFPPHENTFYRISFPMGFLDRALRWALPDLARLAVLCALAALSAARFSRLSPASALVFANALLMMKAQVAWDKYVFLLLPVLWMMKAEGALDPQGPRPAEQGEEVVDHPGRGAPDQAPS